MEKATIYCIKTGETIHYVGKTISVPNAEGEMCKSSCHYQYVNPNIGEIFRDSSASIVPIAVVDHDEWYDKKLSEVVAQHKDKHPLRNAQWMLDGKRGQWEGTGGYWQGKVKDQHTINRMSESKFKPVLQYDKDGKFVKEWESKKAVSIAVFNDYRVKGGGGRTKLYGILNARNPKRHFIEGSYWYAKADFKTVPAHLDIEAMYQEFRKTYKRNYTHHSQYTILYYVRGKLKKTFDNAFLAAKHFGICADSVRKICNGRPTTLGLEFKYGEKKLQPIRNYGK